MKKQTAIPESIRKALVRAGAERAKQITHDERVKWGKLSWSKRLAKAQGK